eukprot:scaffold3227_cov188-Ochromonas_danica.AAC.15
MSIDRQSDNQVGWIGLDCEDNNNNNNNDDNKFRPSVKLPLSRSPHFTGHAPVFHFPRPLKTCLKFSFFSFFTLTSRWGWEAKHPDI